MARQKAGRAHASDRSYYRDEEEEDYEYGFVEVLDESAKALFCCDEDRFAFWVPKSQLGADCADWERGDSGMLSVTQWLAEQQGWD